MRNASMKVLKNLVCCAAFICLMFVLAMPAHAASKADELLQLVNAERAQAGVAPLSMGYYEGGEYGNYWVMIFTYARGTSENGFAQEVLALVNAERAKENLAPLAMGDAKLQAAADERAKEVAKVASHTRPDGTNCFTVLKEYGVSDTATGENAAWGETTPEKVVADWMASEGHRVNIMDPAAKYMCLGYNYDANSQWGHNWIQIFAK